ncbi:hypothetical protein SDC9_166654 [bioreactor metagenome]|uniref:Uncharacterized protein n=1 Tax=bioreactor metagenome TaxID=1076179 RepID=A0A645FXN0_9ZZZZ
MLSHQAIVQQPGFTSLVSEKNILRNSKVRTHVQFLMDDGHSQLLCLFRLKIGMNVIAEQGDGTTVSGVYSTQNFDQCRFSCPIITKQSHYLAGF